MEEYLDIIEYEPEFSDESESDNYDENPVNIKSELKDNTVIIQTKRNRALEKIDAEILRINAIRSGSSKQEGQAHKYYCTICDSKFLFKNTYNQHMSTHQEENPVIIFQCNVCSENFESEAELKEHKMMAHRNEISMHKCRYCDKRFPDIENLNSHYSDSHFKIHPENQLVCDICDRTFAKISDMKSHMKTHIQHVCECCRKEFISVECLEQHEKLHTTEDSTAYQCLKCYNQFETPGGVLQHMLESHSEPETPCCSVCSKTFDSENLLDCHLRLHFGQQKPYQCEICEKRFGSKAQFDCHEKGHFGEKPYQCIECLKCFSRSENFRAHQNQHRLKERNDPTPEEESLVEDERSEKFDEKQWTCKKCLEILPTVFDLHKHDQRVHQGDNRCLLCAAKFTTYSALTVHLRRKFNIRRFECSECGKKFTESNGLNRHLFTHLKERPFKCNECPRSFSLATELNKHKKSHALNENDDNVGDPTSGNGESSGSSQLHECSECGWLTASIQSMKKHMKQRHWDANDCSNLTCEYCGKNFATEMTLAHHIKRIHENCGDYTCETCGNKFNTLLSMQLHSRIHQKTKEWSCLKCVLIFDSEETYHEHIQRHQTESIQQSYSKKSAYKDKPMSCDVCGRKCRGKWWLENHMKTHTGEKPFKCDFQDCGKAFTNNNNLKAHQKTHSGEKSHQCNVCQKLFSERKSLKLHSFLHSGQRPFQCDICGKGFITNHFLNKHVLVHVKSGETKANFPESKRQMIQKQQQLKLIQSQIRHGATENWQMDSSFEEKSINNAVNDGIINQDQGLTTATISKPLDENDEMVEFNEDDIIIYDKSNEIEDAVNYFVVEETENQTFIPSRNVPIMENKCPYCNSNFETQKSLADHVDETHTERPFKCEICQYRFKVKSKLDRHIKIHLNLKAFKCDICGWSFIESYTLKQHMLTHSGHKPFKCEICGLGFRQKSSLNAHKFNCLKTQQEHGVEINEFESLDEVRALKLNDQPGMQFVIEECSFVNGLFQCGYCEKEFKTKDSLVGHLKIHSIQQKSEIMKFQCPYCDFQTTNKGSCVYHTKTIHENEPECDELTLTKEEQNEPLTCHICSKLIKRKCMEKHLEQVHSKCYYRCPDSTCRKLFKTLERIIEHVDVKHPVDGGSQFKCENCPKSFPTEKALNIHSKCHVGENQECDICGMIFSSASNVKRHKMRHFPSEKPFECQICNEKFFTKNSKKSHLQRIHEIDEFE